MKQWLVFMVCLAVILQVAGCNGPAAGNDAAKVIVEGGGEFPESLAGTWNTEGHVWQFVIEPDGKLSSAVIGLGAARIRPGATATFPTRGGGKAIFKAGECTVRYAPEIRELTIEIIIEQIHFEMGAGLLEGSRRDIFIGQVSEDGEIWNADWFNFPDYMAHGSKTKRLTLEPEESYVKRFLFEKTD